MAISIAGVGRERARTVRLAHLFVRLYLPPVLVPLLHCVGSLRRRTFVYMYLLAVREEAALSHVIDCEHLDIEL